MKYDALSSMIGFLTEEAQRVREVEDASPQLPVLKKCFGQSLVWKLIFERRYPSPLPTLDQFCHCPRIGFCDCIPLGFVPCATKPCCQDAKQLCRRHLLLSRIFHRFWTSLNTMA